MFKKSKSSKIAGYGTEGTDEEVVYTDPAQAINNSTQNFDAFFNSKNNMLVYPKPAQAFNQNLDPDEVPMSGRRLDM